MKIPSEFAQTFETSTPREFFNLSHTFRLVLPILLMKFEC